MKYYLILVAFIFAPISHLFSQQDPVPPETSHTTIAYYPLGETLGTGPPIPADLSGNGNNFTNTFSTKGHVANINFN